MGVGRYPSGVDRRKMHSTINSLNDLRVGVVGPGRLGTALAAALREAGVAVDGPAGRGEVPAGCDAIVLCVPDGEIEAASGDDWFVNWADFPSVIALPDGSLAAHWPAGMNSWMNANAGAAVMVSINAETKAAARSIVIFLLNSTSLCPPSLKKRSSLAPLRCTTLPP